MCNSAFISLGTELPLPVFETGRNGTKPKNVHFIHLRFSKTEFRFLMMKFELICINSNLQPFSTCTYVVFFHSGLLGFSTLWFRFAHQIYYLNIPYFRINVDGALLILHLKYGEMWKAARWNKKIEIKAISQSKPPEKTVVERTMDDFAFGVGANVRCEYKSR